MAGQGFTGGTREVSGGCDGVGVCGYGLRCGDSTRSSFCGRYRCRRGTHSSLRGSVGSLCLSFRGTDTTRFPPQSHARCCPPPPSQRERGGRSICAQRHSGATWNGQGRRGGCCGASAPGLRSERAFSSGCCVGVRRDSLPNSQKDAHPGGRGRRDGSWQPWKPRNSKTTPQRDSIWPRSRRRAPPHPLGAEGRPSRGGFA
mmetsp:Transcript_21066/g.49985  ORF Transcript_21066/g.49985 Transcript_21066/m.49985 type:complete len:201 (-) Transcript_21066:702-1304(-)